MQIEKLPIWIIGGASGMGAATAQYLRDKGAVLTIFDRDKQAGQDLATRLGICFYPLDISDASAVADCFQSQKRQNQVPRVVINCAGILYSQKILTKEGTLFDLEAFQKVVQVNLIGAFDILRQSANLMNDLAPLSETGERGLIIQTSSIAATEGQIGQVAYSASKGGINALILPAARELGKLAIRIMGIAPGFVNTPMLASLPDKIQNELRSQIPFPPRFAKAEEFAMLVSQIIENPFLNGSIIRLDGGARLQ